MKHISKLLFYVLSVGILFSNVACDESKKENTEVIKEAIPEEESFDIQPYEWESLPQDIQNQISGAGCNYATVNNENAFYMVNGCVKINGIYELLEEKETGIRLIVEAIDAGEIVPSALVAKSVIDVFDIATVTV